MVALSLVMLGAVLYIHQIGEAVGAVLGALRPIFTGMVVAYLLTPIAKRLETLAARALARTRLTADRAAKVSRAVGVVGSLLILVGLFVAFFSMLLPQLTRSLMGLANAIPDYFRDAEAQVLKWLEDDPQLRNFVETLLTKAYTGLTSLLNPQTINKVWDVVSNVTTSVLSVVSFLVDFLRICTETPGHLLCLVLIRDQKLQLQDRAVVLLHGQVEIHAAPAPGAALRVEEGTSFLLPDQGGQALFRTGTDHVGQAALGDFPVVGTLLRNDPAILLACNVAGALQLVQTLGIVKVDDAVVQQRQLRQSRVIHRRGQTAQYEQNQDLQIQLFMDESKSLLQVGQPPPPGPAPGSSYHLIIKYTTARPGKTSTSRSK